MDVSNCSRRLLKPTPTISHASSVSCICLTEQKARSSLNTSTNKNLRLLAGRSLVAWAVDVALGSRWIDRVIVSTDDPEIAKAGRVAGAEVPFLRPPELARDDSSEWLAWQHAPNDGLQTRDFDGSGSVAVCIPAGVTHAVKNTGGRDVTLSSFSNDDTADTTKRMLLE